MKAVMVFFLLLHLFDYLVFSLGLSNILKVKGDPIRE
jgi:hypothetical protein